MRYYLSMKLLTSAKIDPFALAAIAAILSAMFTYYNTFLDRNFPIYTTGEEIEESVLTEFPALADFLL